MCCDVLAGFVCLCRRQRRLAGPHSFARSSASDWLVAWFVGVVNSNQPTSHCSRATWPLEGGRRSPRGLFLPFFLFRFPLSARVYAFQPVRLCSPASGLPRVSAASAALAGAGCSARCCVHRPVDPASRLHPPSPRRCVSPRAFCSGSVFGGCAGGLTGGRAPCAPTHLHRCYLAVPPFAPAPRTLPRTCGPRAAQPGPADA